MRYVDLASAIDVLESNWVDGKELEIAGLAYHSGKVSAGDLFVCIKGYKTDGHLYLPQAVERGAVAAVVEEFRPDVDLPQFRVQDSRVALAALADMLYGHPSRGLKVIGITATNGKTTTSFMTNAVLEKQGLKTGLIGTVIVKVGNVMRPAVLTTPESLDLHHLFAQMGKQDVTHVTMEVSSSALELFRVGNVAYHIVAINNISREHIDLHGSFENYFKAKAKLTREAGPEQWAIFNLDCPYSASLVSETQAKVITYGMKNANGHLWVKNLDLSSGRGRFTVEIMKPFATENRVYEPQQFEIELSVLGLHTVYNSMVAVITGLLYEIPITTIQAALLEFRGVERRFELIYENDFKIIDDHFANSGNINVTLETLQFMRYRKLLVVYAIRGSRGPTVNRESAEALATWAPKLGIREVIATTSVSHVTEKDVVTDEEMAVFMEVMAAAGIQVQLYAELPEAISKGLSQLEHDDVMLLAGCQGMDSGACITLEQLSLLRPYLEREKLFASLQNRVAGM